MEPDIGLDLKVEEAVAKLREAIGSYAGKLRRELEPFRLVKLEESGEDNLEEVLIQAFIGFAQNCNVPFARLVMLPPLRISRVPPRLRKLAEGE